MLLIFCNHGFGGSDPHLTAELEYPAPKCRADLYLDRCHAGVLMATHHPFTMPNPDDIPLLDEHPERVRAKAYDFVCNGIEVGGGSLRIHDTNLQDKMFKILGFTEERAQAQFGFLMNAFKYGAPPHAGLAFGLDRFVSIIYSCISFLVNPLSKKYL